MANLRLALFLLIAAIAASFPAISPRAAADDDCAGSPPEAVMMLPAPLNKWGQIACTPFGHVLSSHEGWMWVFPDGVGTVFIPSQMVIDNPAPLGNTSYFTKIEIKKVTGGEFEDAYDLFRQGLEQGAAKPDGYRVDLTSISGRTMRVYFFDYDTYAWGMSCPDNFCVRDSRFMVMDKAHKPQARMPSI
jgi:hypothetical protein